MFLNKKVHQSELRDSELNKRLYDINLKSVTEQNSLEEFLNTAELAGTEFESEKLNLKFVKPTANAGVLSNEEQRKLNEMHKKNTDLLRIPRRC
jgi:large subunit GTPase 1